MIGNTHAMHHGGRRPGRGFKSKVVVEEFASARDAKKLPKGEKGGPFDRGTQRDEGPTDSREASNNAPGESVSPPPTQGGQS